MGDSWKLKIEGPDPGETLNLMWSAPVDPGVGTAPGHIRLFSAADDPSGARQDALRWPTPVP